MLFKQLFAGIVDMSLVCLPPTWTLESGQDSHIYISVYFCVTEVTNRETKKHTKKSQIVNQYTVTVINKFDTLEETFERDTPKDEYENFVSTHIKAAAECIPTKPRAICSFLRVTSS